MPNGNVRSEIISRNIVGKQTWSTDCGQACSGNEKIMLFTYVIHRYSHALILISNMYQIKNYLPYKPLHFCWPFYTNEHYYRYIT